MDFCKYKEVQDAVAKIIMEIDCAFTVPFIGIYIDLNEMLNWFYKLRKLILITVEDISILSRIDEVFIDIQKYFCTIHLVPVFFCYSIRKKEMISFLNIIKTELTVSR